MVNFIDDFHNIQSIKQPTNLKLSPASHMTSNLLDLQSNIPAIPLPENCENRHSMVKVQKSKDTIICKGGIKLEVAQQIMTRTLQNHTTTYLQSLPPEHHYINTEMINQQIKSIQVIHNNFCFSLHH